MLSTTEGLAALAVVRSHVGDVHRGRDQFGQRCKRIGGAQDECSAPCECPLRQSECFDLQTGDREEGAVAAQPTLFKTSRESRVNVCPDHTRPRRGRTVEVHHSPRPRIVKRGSAGHLPTLLSTRTISGGCRDRTPGLNQSVTARSMPPKCRRDSALAIAPDWVSGNSTLSER